LTFIQEKFMNWKTGGGSVINLIQRNADLLPLRSAPLKKVLDICFLV
jgi:hypothetical protein